MFKKIFSLLTILSIFISPEVFGAISGSMVWEIRSSATNGDTNNSGGFVGGAKIAAPSAPTVNVTSGGSVAVASYYCVITYTDAFGDTVISGETSATTTGGNQTLVVTSPPASTGATSWNCYFAVASGGPYWPQGTTLTIGSNRTVTTTPPTSGTQPRGVDYTQNDSPNLHIDNLAITATTPGANSNTLTFTLGHTAVGAEVGNTFRATGGTNINQGLYQITAITATTWTVTGAQNLTTATAGGSNITGYMGGAFSSPGQALSFSVNNNQFWIKAGSTYSCSTSSNVSNGRLAPTTNQRIEGYNLVRGDRGTKPILQASANSVTIITLANGCIITNLNMDGTGRTTVVGLNTAASSFTFTQLCKASNFTGTGSTGFQWGGDFDSIEQSQADNCQTGFGIGSGNRCNSCNYNSATSCVTGFSIGPGVANNCIAVSCNTGFSLGSSSVIHNCTAYGNNVSSAVGFNATGTTLTNALYGCICTNYTGVGAIGFSVNTSARMYSCAVFNNTANVSGTPFENLNFIILTGDPFINAAGNNFTLNTTAGAGAACRFLSQPNSWGGISATTYTDIGAIQSKSTGNIAF